MPRITLYSKPGCHLCDVVKDVIDRVRQRRAFELEIRNIQDDPADFERYRNDIPVVMVNGREIARHRLSEVRLEWGLNTVPTLVVMAKAPEPGRVKTRLMPELSAEQAAAVQGIFLRHVVSRLHPLGEVVVCFDPPDAENSIRRILEAEVRWLAQSTGDLGVRLAGAFDSLASDRVFFFGVDSPDVPLSFVEQVLEHRPEIDLVLGPSEDGGVWCMGLGETVDAAALLSGIEWSTGREMRQIADRARSLGYRLREGARWDDVDRPQDLRRLVTRLRKSDNAQNMQLLRELELVQPPLGEMS